MFICTLKLDRKKLAFAVIMIALVIIGIILLLGTRERAGSDAPARASTQHVSKEKGRVAYLAQYGWEVETPALSEEQVVIPRTFSPVFERYNELQKQQGFDLSEYCGMEVTMYTYKVTNSAFRGDEVLTPSGSTILEKDDVAVAIVARDGAREIEALFPK